MFLDAASRARLRQTAQRVQELPAPALGTDQDQALRVTAAYQGWVRLTGARVEPGYYPGVVTLLDRTAASFTDRADVLVWVRSPAFGLLDPAGIYWGRAEGAQTVAASQRVLYLVDDPSADGGMWECAAPSGPTMTFDTGLIGNAGCTDCANAQGALSLTLFEAHRWRGPEFLLCGVPCRWELFNDVAGVVQLNLVTLKILVVAGGERSNWEQLPPGVWDEVTPLVLGKTGDDGSCFYPASITVTPA